MVRVIDYYDTFDTRISFTSLFQSLTSRNPMTHILSALSLSPWPLLATAISSRD